VDVLLNSLDVASHEVHFVGDQALTCAFCLTDLIDRVKVFSPIEACNLTGVEDVIDVLEHLFIDNLGVDEDKSGGFVFNTGLHEHGLDVVAPITHRVTFDHLNLKLPVVRDVSRKSCKTLSARAAHTEQQTIT